MFTFTAKTSELLLAVGLIASTANFLTDGSVMGNNATLATAWAWAQSLAIDSSLGVTCYYLFVNIKQRDWIKVFCYGLLTCLLAVVAGTITNVDTLSHEIHTSIAVAIAQVGLNIKSLTTLRAIAVVGFLLMGRLKEVSFKELYTASPPQNTQALQVHSEKERSDEQIKALIAEAVAPFMAIVAQQAQTIITVQETVPLPALQTTAATSKQQEPSSTIQEDGESKIKMEVEVQELPGGEIFSEERETRLARAYATLQAEGERISGRTLAAHAHVRRTTCNQWLATHHPEVTNDEPAEETEHEQ